MVSATLHCVSILGGGLEIFLEQKHFSHGCLSSVQLSKEEKISHKTVGTKNNALSRTPHVRYATFKSTLKK